MARCVIRKPSCRQQTALPIPHHPTSGTFRMLRPTSFGLLLIMIPTLIAASTTVKAGGTAIESVEIQLDSGWNAVALVLTPPDLRLGEIFKDILDDIVLVKDDAGHTFVPGFAINTIGEWNPYKAYMVNVRQPVTLTITGTRVDQVDVHIDLHEGWNMVPFYGAEVLAAESVFADLLDDLVVAKDLHGNVFYPEMGINNIGKLEPGVGYQVNMRRERTLVYRGNGDTIVTPDPDYRFDLACLSSTDAHRVTDFGLLVADVNEAAAIAANSLTINTAIDAVGQQGGGTICLPAGIYHVAPADLTITPLSQVASIIIDYDNITLWGAGRNDDGEGTALYSRGEYSIIDGRVVRGSGLRIRATGRNSANPRRNITLRDFELNGQSGYTGCFSWRTQSARINCWDTSHKGIVFTNGDWVTDVRVERVWIRSFKGEVLYQGGNRLGRILFDDIISEDTNASTFNVHGEVTVTNSRFGKSRFWMELDGHFAGKSGTFTNNHFHDAHIGHGISFAQGDMSEIPYLFEGNTFERCNFVSDNSGMVFMIAEGVAGPVTVRNNTFTDCGVVMTGTGGKPGDTSRNFLFEDNEVKMRGGTGVNLSSTRHHIVIRNNSFEWDESNPGISVNYAWGRFTGVVIENNTFHNERAPNRGGSSVVLRPLFVDNEYSYARTPQLGANVRPASPWVAPTHERQHLNPLDEDIVEVSLSSGTYPDGQEVIFTGRLDRAALFSVGNPTYEVSQDWHVKGDQGLKLRYDASRETWMEVKGISVSSVGWEPATR